MACYWPEGRSYITCFSGKDILQYKKGGMKMTQQQEIAALQAMVDDSRRIVFFGGAGVSTESGIPDFRSVDGLYSQQYTYPPEEMLSHTMFQLHPEEFYRFYRNKMLYLDAKPNAAHRKLAELEAAGKLSAVVTQNIDGLHQAAGSQKVYELHGSVYRNYCTRCGKMYAVQDILRSEGIPKCTCGGIIKPDVVLYEEGLDQEILQGALRAIQEADMLIIGGTSLVVYPANGLVEYFHGKHLAVINKSPTHMDGRADLVIAGSIGEILERIQVSASEKV